MSLIDGQLVIQEKPPDQIIVSEVGPQGPSNFWLLNGLDLTPASDPAPKVADVLGILQKPSADPSTWVWGPMDVATQPELDAVNVAAVHIAGAETVTGAKDFTGALTKSGTAVEIITGSQAKADAAQNNAEAYADANFIPLTQRAAPNGVATLDAGGLIPNAQLPPLAITDTFVDVSQAAMLAESAQVGDVSVRTDLHKSFILRVADPTVLGHWQELQTPIDSVLSVNGYTGVVNLIASDIGFTSLTGMAATDVRAGLDALNTDARMADQRVPTNGSVTLAKIVAGGLDPTAITGTAVITTDARLSDARAPTGAAGGVLSGTYPNPGFASAPSFTGLVTITAPSASAQALVTKAFASQTANIWEARDSTNAVLASIGSDGTNRGPSFRAVTAGLTYLATDYDSHGLGVVIQNDAHKGLVIRRNSATQSADLQEWQDESGGLLIYVDSGGVLRRWSSGSYLFNSAVSPSNLLKATNATTTALAVRAASTQSANIFEVQDVFGNPQFHVTATGQIMGNAGLSVGSTKVTPADGQFRMGSTNPSLYWDRTTGGGDWLMYTAGTTSLYLRDGVNGRMAQQWSANTAGNASTKINGLLQVQAEAASQILTTVKGFASQTGDLFQAQDSTGTVQASIGSSGDVRTWMLRAVANSQATLKTAADTGGLLLQTGSDTNKGLVIRRNSATQSANLLEWQDQNSGLIGWFSQAGSFRTNGFGTFGDYTFTGPQLSVAASSASVVGLAVKGFASQSADLMQLQDSTGTVLIRATTGGGIGGASGSAVAVFNGDTGGIRLGTNADANKGLVIRGNSATQTADLLQMQGSTGAVLTKVGPFGAIQSYGVTHTFDNLAVPTGVAAGAPAAGGAFAAGTYYWVVTATNAAGETVKSAEVTATPALNQQVTISWTQVTGATGYKVYRSTVSGTYTTPALVATITNGATVSYVDTGSAVGAGAPSTPVGTKVIFKSWVSQSDNLFEWQNFAGTVLVKINQNGSLILNQGATVTSPANFTVLPTSAASVVAQFRGIASQSGDLTQWMDSSGGVLARITSSGVLDLSGASDIVVGNNKAIYSNAGDIRYNVPSGSKHSIQVGNNAGLLVSDQAAGTVQAISRAATSVSLLVKGFASQSANLQEWQNSAGTVTSRIDPSGNHYVHIGGAGSAYGVLDSNGRLYLNPGNVAGLAPASLDATLVVGSRGVSVPNVIVRAGASQTSDIQQWQNSAATVLARITAGGSLGIGTNDFGSGVGVIGLLNATTLPSTNPVGGGALYADAGALKWRGSSGTVTTVAPA